MTTLVPATVYVSIVNGSPNGELENPFKPFNTLDGAVNAVNAVRTPENYTIWDVIIENLLTNDPDNIYEMNLDSYTGFNFIGVASNGLAISNKKSIGAALFPKRSMIWDNVTINNINLIIYTNYNYIDNTIITIASNEDNRSGVGIGSNSILFVTQELPKDFIQFPIPITSFDNRLNIFRNYGAFEINSKTIILTPSIYINYILQGGLSIDKVPNSYSTFELPESVEIKGGSILYLIYSLNFESYAIIVGPNNQPSNIVSDDNIDIVTILTESAPISENFMVNLSDLDISITSNKDINLFNIIYIGKNNQSKYNKHIMNKSAIYKLKYKQRMLIPSEIPFNGIRESSINDAKVISNTVKRYNTNGILIEPEANISKMGFFDGLVKTIVNIGDTIVTSVDVIDTSVNVVNKVLNFVSDTLDTIIPASPITALNVSFLGLELPDQNSVIQLLDGKSSKQSMIISSNGTRFREPIHTDLIQPNGSTFNTGSDLNGVVTIEVNYTHNQHDGVYFLIDASKQDITITIPPVGTSLADEKWSGRRIVYKRIDFSSHKVNIVNRRGLFDKRCNTICLKNEKCNLTALQILINYDGEAYLISKF